MVNYLAFFERAGYGESSPSISGSAAYKRYGQVAARAVYLLGGRVVFLGAVEACLGEATAASTSGPWHEVAIVDYPSRFAFSRLTAMPGYTAALAHRRAGLQRTVLALTEAWRQGGSGGAP
jgi:uncharacterized protein (DUF1330 family)